MINNILSYPGVILEQIIRSRYFTTIASNPVLATIILVAIVLFWSFPSYDIAIYTNEMSENWDSIFLQAKEPFVNHNHLYAHGSHAEKLAFRFVPPVILSILHMDNLLAALLFQFLTLILFYYLLICVLNKLLTDKIKAFLFALPICFVIAGHVYISDYRGIFDTLALDFLLIAILFRDKIYVIVLLLLAYFTDERALIASPAIFLINIFTANSYENIKSTIKSLLYSSNIYLLVSWILYLLIRFSLFLAFGLSTGTGDIGLFIVQINKTFFTFYIGLEGFIIPFFLTGFFLLKKRIYTFFILTVFSFLLIFYAAQSVIDITRSMSYLILFIILITLLIDKFYVKETSVKIIAWVIILNILYDDSFPLLAQIYRMKFITHTI